MRFSLCVVLGSTLVVLGCGSDEPVGSSGSPNDNPDGSADGLGFETERQEGRIDLDLEPGRCGPRGCRAQHERRGAAAREKSRRRGRRAAARGRRAAARRRRAAARRGRARAVQRVPRDRALRCERRRAGVQLRRGLRLRVRTHVRLRRCERMRRGDLALQRTRDLREHRRAASPARATTATRQDGTSCVDVERVRRGDLALHGARDVREHRGQLHVHVQRGLCARRHGLRRRERMRRGDLAVQAHATCANTDGQLHVHVQRRLREGRYELQ